MRIVAGSRKGHRLEAPRGVVTRPTGDRAREALFSILGSVEGARVLDLFAGSGALGLEALSRGAAEAVFVERDPRARRVLERNVARLDVAGRATVVGRDAVRFLTRPSDLRYDIVLLDPPYDDWPRLEGRLAELLHRVVAPEGVVAVETAAGLAPSLPFDVVTTRRYGSARITVFRTS